MKIFGTLYIYECKKLLHKKIVWISFILCIAAIILTVSASLFGDYYVEGELIDTHYNMYQTDKAYATALNGREINQRLLEETIEAYRRIPETFEGHYTLTPEYQQYARPYSAIFNFIAATTDMQTSEVILSWQPDENDLYAQRQTWLKSLWENDRLSIGEMRFWQERESQIEKPFVYQEHEGFEELLSSYQTVGLVVLIFIAISLSGVFSEEHTRRTDQLILCSPLGKTKLYWAKIMAGISFSVGITVLFFLFTFILTLCLFGANGHNAAFQLIYAANSDPITCVQAVLIAYGNMLVAAILASVFVMVLSELLHSNIATLAISTGLLIISLIVVVPEQYRVLAQIWEWFPCCFLTPWSVFGKYTISMFGHYFTPWQAVPIIYFVASVVIAAIGRPVYQRFQVSGR